MDIRDKQKIANSVITASTMFNGALDEVPDDPVEQLAMVIPSSTKTEEHGWLGTVPGFSEWKGDRKLGTLRADGFQLTNRSWANGLRLLRDSIVDDRWGIVRPKIQMLAKKARRHRGKYIVEVMANGFDGARPETGDGRSYDGAFLFSDDHQDGDGPRQSNLGEGPLTHETYAQARRQMRKLVDEEGDPLDIEPSHLLVGPDLEDAAREILENDVRIVQGVAVKNIYRGSTKLLVSPRLIGPWASYWFLADLTQPVRPMVLQIRQEIQFNALDDMSSDAAFMRKEFKFGADARYVVGPGMWQFIYGSKGEA